MFQTLKSTKYTTIHFSDQKAGTSGLRKSTRTFQQINYVQNFIQSFLNALDADIEKDVPQNEPVSIFIGGDGRFFVPECAEIIIKMCAAHPRINKVYVAQNGLMSTPAVSCCIRKYKTFAGVILTARLFICSESVMVKKIIVLFFVVIILEVKIMILVLSSTVLMADQLFRL